MVNTNPFFRKLGKSIRWLGRGLSILIILFWGFFFIMDIFGEEVPHSRSLNVQDYIQLILMSAWFIGLIVSWKRELIGGVVVVTSFIIFGFVNSAAFTLPFPLILIVGLVFILSWWLNKPSKQFIG